MATEKMGKSRMPGVQKIQWGVIISLVMLILALSGSLVSYGRGNEAQNKDIIQLRKDVDRALSNSERIPVIEVNVKYLKEASDRMETKLNLLLIREE